MRTTILAAAMMAALASCTASSDSLQHDLEAYTATCDAEIGVAVITDRSDTICVNNDRPYPMNSVVKLYQAMAVAATLEQRGTPLDTVITIARDELHPQPTARYATTAPATHSGSPWPGCWNTRCN